VAEATEMTITCPRTEEKEMTITCPRTEEKEMTITCPRTEENREYACCVAAKTIGMRQVAVEKQYVI
jgi:hypothetical protein